MLKASFKDKTEMDIYVAEQKVRMESGFLTKSERETLKQMIEHPKNYIHKEIPTTIKGLPIITDISKLRRPCEKVQPKENVSEIIKALKDSLTGKHGVGLSANQIGFNKRVAYICIPRPNNKVDEYILINPKIIEKTSPIAVPESCLSIPGITVMVDRFKYITITNTKLNGEEETIMMQDWEGFVFQHEIAHLNGRTILEDKHRAR
jgi:peptide deformylase